MTEQANRNEAQTSVWSDLVAAHGGVSNATRHNSRHIMLDNVTDLTASVADIYATTVIFDTMLNVSGSGANLFGMFGSGDGAEESARSASDLLGSLLEF